MNAKKSESATSAATKAAAKKAATEFERVAAAGWGCTLRFALLMLAAPQTGRRTGWVAAFGGAAATWLCIK